VRVERWTILTLLALMLAGCASHSLGCSTGLSSQDCPPGSAGYQQQQQADAKATAAEAATAAQDDAECRSQGLQPDTPAYEKCRTRLADQRTYSQDSDRMGVAGRLLGRSPMAN
jgi:hypothetical protein